MLGFLSNCLFKAILPLKWDKGDCIGTTEHSEYPGGLHSSSEAGLSSQSCALPHCTHCTPPPEPYKAAHLRTAMSHRENALGITAGTAHPALQIHCGLLLASEKRRDRQEWCPTEHLPQDCSGREAWMDGAGGHFAFFFKASARYEMI